MKRSLILAAAALISLLPVAGHGADAGKPVHPAVSSARPEAVKPKEQTPVTGKVMQTMNGGGYSYILLKKASGDKVWLAVPQMDVELGATLTFKPGMEMADLQSKALNRTFEKIIFSEGLVDGKGGKNAKKSAKKSPGSKGSVATAGEKIKVKKATGPNAYTVAELYKLKGKLDKKKVVVSGKVVRVSAGIMGKNWVHIQDGSGDAKKGTHDLVVTSQAVPVIGEVVTASGTLYKNKDFGGGYKYEVIVEKAELEIQ
ncbi:hypothetical protein [Geotalea uraniireducens]|uniref:Nucleic acid binding, OB-fold, tRNA/helicase-type n=1 Tax=Geotalea uraniireducens (strain Rf4) TaxID=351605 RepID=A5GDU0_GEOUR|nr:hypothetical protein [Geotalea uraniireducens]ABQ24247.1 nucleic acid binding, OB-fold, tRNA/helicase-type [Geotalea uraniireducens Rf4]